MRIKLIQEIWIEKSSNFFVVLLLIVRLDIVIDNSTVFIGSQNLYNKQTGRYKVNPAIRLTVEKLAKVIEKNKLGSDIRTRLVGGSTPPRYARVRNEWESCGYRSVLGDRSVNNKEVFVDNMLHSEIYGNLFHHQRTQNRPPVLLLVTGDGNANFGQISFPVVVERALKSDWKEKFPAQMDINYLDPHRKTITFEEKTEQN